MFQERFLSHRIMHFTMGGVYWECLQAVTSETPPTFSFRVWNFLADSWLKRWIGGVNQPVSMLVQEDSSFLYTTWMEALARYTRCSITKRQISRSQWHSSALTRHDWSHFDLRHVGGVPDPRIAVASRYNARAARKVSDV